MLIATTIYRFLFLIPLLLILSCSSEKPADVSDQKPSEIGKGTVSETSQPQVFAPISSYSLEITPSDASRHSIIHVIPRGFILTDAKIEWLVNSQLTTNPVVIQFNAAEVKKGDKIQVKAILQGKEILSNIIQIKNAPPEISKARIFPEDFKPGDTLSAEAFASDIDGDEVTISYEWTKNGEPAGRGKKIEIPIKRGDKVSVKITPFDGEVYGRSVILHREIVNLPPMIIDDKKFNFDGKVYSYQVKATDPDGDTLTYSLKSAPSGMTINPTTGQISWNVPPEFTGKVPITISVTDGHGGEALQSFTLNITPEKR